MTVSAEYDINQDQIERMDMTISVTMTVAEWRAVENQLHEPQHSAPNQLKWAINTAIANVRNVAGKKFRYPQS